MDFIHYDLGQLAAGSVIEVTLDAAANVQLLDSANLSSYRTGGQYLYYGGHVTRSPYRIKVPQTGHWHLAIDLGGVSGTVRASVRVLAASPG